MASKKSQDSDDRFLRVKKDPRFWEMPERERKIKIDKRFQSMFHDKRFKLKYTVDKRGRPFSHTSAEDLKRFYDLTDSDQSDGQDEKQKGKRKKQKSKVKVGPEENTQETLDDMQEKTAVEASEKPEKLKKVLERSSKPTAAQTVKGVTEYAKGQEVQAEEDKKKCVQGDEEALDSGSDLSEQYETDEEGDEEGNEEEESASESEEESEEDSDSGPDLARGKGNIETSSDEDEEDEIDKLLRHEEEEIQHDWGEMWKDAPRSEDVTHRLAVCNVDWDRLKGKDLLALFNSFKPKGGVVLSVKIYPSEFGKERMKIEQAQGPLELVALPEDPEQDTEEERTYREKMRDYQFKRMRYYYAVVECDSRETASKIYEECDGYEYESSSSVLDLRFIPDELTFDELPKDVATDVDLAAYNPKYFTSTAMATSKVELTWDETDHERVTTLSRKFKKDEILDMDFQAYLASSSEDDDDPEDEDLEGHEDQEVGKKTKKSHKNDAEQIAKYRELLKDLQHKDVKLEDKAMEMEVTWVPGLKETTEELVKKKLEKKIQLTPWEEFLQKKKEKRKQKKAERKQAAPQSDLSGDDDLPPDVDLSDPYFAEELGISGSELKTKSKKMKKSKEEERTPDEEIELERQKAEMALLMGDEDEEDAKRKHFNYDKIVEQQNLSKKKKKKLQKRNELLDEDDFEVDVKDPRFQAMFTSHLYNLDPSDPGYKKTKATQRILEEKQRLREEQQQEDVTKRKQRKMQQEVGANEQPIGPTQAKDPGLSMLIRSVKNKTEQFQARKKQKMTK
ncbi:ESF1 homolog [Paramormyrops kingsleyae]|uniref:ESF1 homolog n=1 Tax=Paramormyrops kingsleyae TaxID=1676925 RepID=UPI003B9733B4